MEHSPQLTAIADAIRLAVTPIFLLLCRLLARGEALHRDYLLCVTVMLSLIGALLTSFREILLATRHLRLGPR